MRVAVFGLGYVGSVTAACLAREGHVVVGVDPDARKVDMIRAGRSPIMEQGLDELVAEGHASGRLDATTEASIEQLEACDVMLVCVGTPSRPNGSLELRYLERVSEQIGSAITQHRGYPVVVFRSTMLPGTTEGHLTPILERASGRRAGADFGVAMCPEFLREASGVADFYDPPYTVVGSSDERAVAAVRELLGFIDRPLHATSTPTAEAMKYASNAFHAVKVCFANEIGRWSRLGGADARTVMDLFCEDDRLNVSRAYLRPGFAYGGSCLPKDLRAVVHHARSHDVDLPLLASVPASNETHLRTATRTVIDAGVRSVAILGISFKPGTDDLRESPYVELAETLIGKGLDVAIYDANVNLDRLFGANLRYVEEHLPHLRGLLHSDPSAALRGRPCAIVSSSAPAVVSALLAEAPAHVLDLTGRLSPEVERLAGYQGVAW